MNRMIRPLAALAGAGIFAGLAWASVAAADAPAPHTHLTTAAATSAPADTPAPIVKHFAAPAPAPAVTSTTAAPTTTVAPAPKPAVTPVRSAAVTTPTTVWTGPTYNGQPCTGCTTGHGQAAPTGSMVTPTGSIAPVNDPLVYFVDPNSGLCGSSGQAEATADHLEVVPAADCGPDNLYNQWGWTGTMRNPPPGADAIPCCTALHQKPPDLIFTCWNGVTVDLTTGGQCTPAPASVGAIKPDGSCVTTTYDNASAQGWQILLQGCPATTSTTSSTTSPSTS